MPDSGHQRVEVFQKPARLSAEPGDPFGGWFSDVQIRCPCQYLAQQFTVAAHRFWNNLKQGSQGGNGPLHADGLSELAFEQGEGVGQAGERLGADQRRIKQGKVALAQGKQGTDKVAAIYRRNIGGRQRRERFGVVPVQQMALVALQPLQCR